VVGGGPVEGDVLLQDAAHVVLHLLAQVELVHAKHAGRGEHGGADGAEEGGVESGADWWGGGGKGVEGAALVVADEGPRTHACPSKPDP